MVEALIVHDEDGGKDTWKPGRKLAHMHTLFDLLSDTHWSKGLADRGLDIPR
jgi:hypothetical protein